MHSIFDVAQYILSKQGEMTAMKLQKLCYYAQAWSLAWDDVPLFPEDFQAWASGPVCPELFRAHKGHFILRPGFFSSVGSDRRTPENLFNADQTETLEIVLRDYGQYEPYQISGMTHLEKPWRDARGGTQPGYPCETIIEKEAMREHYSGLIS